jgi:transcriptional regulator with XRE-family HTH domain
MLIETLLRTAAQATRSSMSDRFWSKVDRRADTECWPWLGHSHQRGYGIFWHEGKNVRANRHALLLSKGGPPFEDAMALHTCDNPPCCNPMHLRWGTAKQNVDDRDLRGRSIRATAKVTEATVSEIYRRRLRGFTCNEIAEQLRLSKHLVMNIYTGRAWRHLLGVNGNPTLEELRAAKNRRPHSAPNRVLTDDMIDDIFRSRVDGQTIAQIAERLGLPKGTVSPVFCGLSFASRLGVDGNPTLAELRACRSVGKHVKITDDDIIEIRALLAQGYTGKSIAARYGVSPPTISNILRGKR